MKKGIFLTIFSIVVLSSCVKQRSCECTSTNTEIPSCHFTETIYYTATKNSAEANCEANEDNTAPIITTCELK
jgi:hypothetical protein